jgi:hypothetical protein
VAICGKPEESADILARHLRQEIQHEPVPGLYMREANGVLEITSSEEFRAELRDADVHPETYIEERIENKREVLFVDDVNELYGVGGLTEAPAIAFDAAFIDTGDYAFGLHPSARVYYDADYQVRNWAESLRDGYTVKLALALDCRITPQIMLRSVDARVFESPLSDAGFHFWELRTGWHGQRQCESPHNVWQEPLALGNAMHAINAVHDEGYCFALVFGGASMPFRFEDCTIEHARMLLNTPATGHRHPIGLVSYAPGDGMEDHMREKIAAYRHWLRNEYYSVGATAMKHEYLDEAAIPGYDNAVAYQEYALKSAEQDSGNTVPAIPTFVL